VRTKPLNEFLQSADALARLQAHALQLLRLQRIFEELAPAQLSASSRIANYRTGILIIHTNNGAVANKLRQLTPRFIDGFFSIGVDLTGIEVRLQVSADEDPAPVPASREISAASREALEKLGQDLPVDSPVRAALARLGRR
jgi:hypothetical protein